MTRYEFFGLCLIAPFVKVWQKAKPLKKESTEQLIERTMKMPIIDKVWKENGTIYIRSIGHNFDDTENVSFHKWVDNDNTEIGGWEEVTQQFK